MLSTRLELLLVLVWWLQLMLSCHLATLASIHHKPPFSRFSTFLLRLTRVLLKLSPLWSLSKRVTKWDPLKLLCFPNLELGHSLMVSLSSLFMTMDPFSSLRCSI